MQNKNKEMNRILAYLGLLCVAFGLLLNLSGCSHAKVIAGHKESDSKFGWFNMGKEEFDNDQSRLKDSTLFYCTAETGEPVCKQPTVMRQE